jgi:hypothetical protein
MLSYFTTSSLQHKSIRRRKLEHSTEQEHEDLEECTTRRKLPYTYVRLKAILVSQENSEPCIKYLEILTVRNE